MVAFDGMVVVVNPQNTWCTDMTVAELKKLWEPEAQGKITRWNQIRSEWPDQEIHLFGAGVESGTYDYFTEVIVGKSHSSRGDFTASEVDNVLVQGVSSDKNALGFFGLAYYEANKEKLKAIGIDDSNEGNGAGPVMPTIETVKNKSYAPLGRPLYIYVNSTAAARPEIKEFVGFYLEEMNALAEEVGFIPLTDEEISLLNYPSVLNNEDLFRKIHGCKWNEEIALNEFFMLKKISGDLITYSTAAMSKGEGFNIIYYDAFAPLAQPELWTAEIFKKLYSMLAPGGILVTYCSKGIVRRTMQAAGFAVEKIPGPPGKREMIRAKKVYGL